MKENEIEQDSYVDNLYDFFTSPRSMFNLPRYSARLFSPRDNYSFDEATLPNDLIIFNDTTCADILYENVYSNLELFPGNIITFLAMIGQGLFGGELAFKYISLGLQGFCSHFMSEKNAEITANSIAVSSAILITAAVIWGKYKLVRSFNRDTITVQGLKDFFTIESKTGLLKSILKLPFVLMASAVFAGLNGVSLDGFSSLLLEQSKAPSALIIANAANSMPSKWILGISAFISNYFGFFGIMEYGTKLVFDILFMKNPLLINFNYTKAEERLMATIRTMKNYTGLLYENNKFKSIKKIIAAILPSYDLNNFENYNTALLGWMLDDLRLKLNDGTLIEKIIEETNKIKIHPENKIEPRTILQQIGQWTLGNIFSATAALGVSNFIEITTPSIEQLCLMVNHSCTLNNSEQKIFGAIDYTAMIMLSVLSVYNLGYFLFSDFPKSEYKSNVGTLSCGTQSLIVGTCALGGMPNILQSIIVGQAAIFPIVAELSSALIEYDGFKNIEKKQYLESLKSTEPFLWFMISFHNILEEAIQQIPNLKRDKLKEINNLYENHDSETKLPKSKYVLENLLMWKKPKNPLETPILNNDTINANYNSGIINIKDFAY